MNRLAREKNPLLFEGRDSMLLDNNNCFGDIFGCLFHYLFRPTPKLLALSRDLQFQATDKYGRQVLSNVERFWTLHLRTGGNTTWSDPVRVELQDGLEKLMQRAAQLSESRLGESASTIPWLFLSDSVFARAQALQHDQLGRIAVLGTEPQHIDRSEHSSAETMAEWWLMAHSSLVIAATRSGFSQTAAAVGFVSYERIKECSQHSFFE